MKNKNITLLTLLAIGLFCIGYFPVFQVLARKWADSFDYTYAFFTVPVLVYMVWQRRDFFLESKDGGYFGLGCVVLSSLLYILSLQLQIPTFSSLFMLMTIASAFIYMAGIRVLKVLAIPLLLMLLLIPIPNQVYSMLTLPLQLKVSEISGLLLQQFSIPLLREGNVLSLPGKVFEVVEACSGIRSLMALCSLSLMLGYFSLRRNLSVLVLLASSLPIAIVVNIIRVVSLVLVYHFFRIDLAEGIAHTISSSVIFCISLVLLYLLQRILESWETKKLAN
jgi:exosortase